MIDLCWIFYLQTPDSGISTGTTATLGSLSKEAPHENTQLVYSKGLRYRSPMGVPWKGRSPEAAGVQCGLSRSSSMPTYRDVYDEDIDVEPSLFDGRRYLLDNAKYSKRVVAEGFELHSDANGNAIYDEALDDIEESARHQQSRDYVAPLDTPTLKRKLAEFSIGDDLPRRRRNYSMCSDASASTNFSYRESLCSKGFSIDLGEALSDFADSEIYDVGSVSVRTESNMEDIQRELRQIRLEINEMNEAVTHLNSKEELVARQRYSLGTADVAEKDVAIWGHVRERLRSRDRSASVENLETHEGRQGYDFMWDYQCDLGTSAALLSRSEQSFLAKRPVFGSDMSLSDDNSTSLQSPCHLEHVRKYLETSPVHGSKVPQSQTNQSIAGIFIDDEYDAPTSAEKEKVRLVVGFQCNDSAQMPQQGIVTCTNCGHKAVPIMNASFSESMASSGIHSNYASESSLDTRHSLSVGSSLRSTSRSTDEISRSDTVLCAHPTSRWQVTNVEPKKNIYEYAETGLTVDGEKAANTKKVSILYMLGIITALGNIGLKYCSFFLQGYHQVCQLLGMSQMRRVRSDNYCAIRAVLFQSLVNNMPILQHSGSLQQVLQVNQWPPLTHVSVCVSRLSERTINRYGSSLLKSNLCIILSIAVRATRSINHIYDSHQMLIAIIGWLQVAVTKSRAIDSSENIGWLTVGWCLIAIRVTTPFSELFYMRLLIMMSCQISQNCSQN